MESFIVRIYRRSEPAQPGPVGTVEDAVTGERIAFHNPEELMAVLDNTASASGVSARRPLRKR